MRIPFRVNDLGLRLQNGILRYRGHPYVALTNNSETITLIDLVSRQVVEEVHYQDEDLDISCIPLGYCQTTHRQVDYLSRIPRQTARHLVTRDSVRREPVIADGEIPLPEYWFSQGMVDCILGNYPSLEEAFDRINAETRMAIAVAISRDICLVKKEGREIVEVLIRNSYSGWIAPNSREISVKGDFMSPIIQKSLSKHGLNYRAA